jgi:hypothetical protein
VEATGTGTYEEGEITADFEYDMGRGGTFTGTLTLVRE